MPRSRADTDQIDASDVHDRSTASVIGLTERSLFTLNISHRLWSGRGQNVYNPQKRRHQQRRSRCRRRYLRRAIMRCAPIDRLASLHDENSAQPSVSSPPQRQHIRCWVILLGCGVCLRTDARSCRPCWITAHCAAGTVVLFRLLRFSYISVILCVVCVC